MKRTKHENKFMKNTRKYYENTHKKTNFALKFDFSSSKMFNGVRKNKALI